MNEILKYLIETSIIISVFYLIYILVYLGDKNSKFNRIYLISSSFLAIILPILRFPILDVQKIEYSTSIHHAIQLPEIIISDGNTIITSQSPFNLTHAITLIYFIGLAFFFARFLYELYFTIKHIRINSDRSQKVEKYTIIKTKGELPTSSFYKYLFWDDSQSLNENESNFIIKHEEGHIRQKHTFDLIYLEILRIIFWFNPIFHGYKKAMLSIHEFLADEFALANSNKQGFIALLGRQVLQKHNLTLSNHFSKSQTVKRIKMIKSEKKKPAVLRWTVMVSIVIAMFYFFSCEQGYTLNEIAQADKDLPVLGTGWSYESVESLSPGMSEKLNKLREENPSTEFYIAKGIQGNVSDFDFNNILEKYSFKSFYLTNESEYVFVILGKIDKEHLELSTPNDIEGEEIFKVVDNQPVPVDGLPAFYKFISENLKYPEEARKAGIEGKVFIEFVVTKEGSVANVKCVRGIGDLCDEEAVRVIQNSPAWNPGSQQGEKVNVRLVLPIAFNLGGSGEKKE
jgi:TonB family protein